MEKVERLEQEYNKLKKASEFIMSAVEGMETEDLKKKIFDKRKKRTERPHRTAPPLTTDTWYFYYYFNELIY
jgi:hypothetical protein